MSEDARFEDARETPLNLGALDPDDLQVISALAQDGILTGADMQWDPRRRRLALLINRVRREQPVAGLAPERVRSVLAIDGVEAVQSQGIDRKDKDLVLSVLSITFEPTEPAPSGYIVLTLAGDGLMRAKVEAIEVTLRDVTRPYRAPSGKTPDHEV
ncbi:DUF2948 family protein [Cognatishimia sp. F0-27]|uniref:DUF2948 family protein n=1 Tax=Cognatishimia sp. F0-27 TaxID=2816855 RepID=UPI001D0C3A2B|nr:DUF2948 family protein [Cognatishimia sp. F0-27]MCC1495017.1 DUF2948 family protein [Cognatishimia sp. F0-27]